MRHRRLRTQLLLAAIAALIGVGCWHRTPDASRVAAIVAVDSTAGRQAPQACSAHSLRGVQSYWTVPRTIVDSLDPIVLRRVDSLFTRLRDHTRFRHLGDASDYHRQYLGIWFDGRPLIYVHGVERPTLVQRGVMLRTRALRDSLVALCDGGTGVIGMVFDPQLRALGRLEFGGGFAGGFAYEDIIPPRT